MSNGLTLPFVGSAISPPGSVFQITQGDPGTETGSGGSAIAGYAYGTFDGLPSIGVLGVSDVGNGFQGYSGSGFGVAGTSGSAMAGVYGTGGRNGVWGQTGSVNDAGVFGENDGGGNGVFGMSTSGTGVGGGSTDGFGVDGHSVNGTGVHGVGSANGASAGVMGEIPDGTSLGMLATGFYPGNTDYPIPIGVYGSNVHAPNYGYSSFGYAGVFDGDVVINGFLEKWSSFFKIDHPLDPANKYLRHSAVESAEMKNMYDGIARLDASGKAVVKLPAWFEALNVDFRYQLTAIGAPSPALHIAKEISRNHFKIAGGKPRSKVSWQVTGNRHDPIAKLHPIQVEQKKAPYERGKYACPKAYGMPETKAIVRFWGQSGDGGSISPIGKQTKAAGKRQQVKPKHGSRGKRSTR